MTRTMIDFDRHIAILWSVWFCLSFLQSLSWQHQRVSDSQTWVLHFGPNNLLDSKKKKKSVTVSHDHRIYWSHYLTTPSRICWPDRDEFLKLGFEAGFLKMQVRCQLGSGTLQRFSLPRFDILSQLPLYDIGPPKCRPNIWKQA